MYQLKDTLRNKKLVGLMFALSQVLVQVSALIGTFSVLILPPDDDTQGLEDNQTWRILVGAGAVFMIIFLVLLLTLLRFDAPRFYLTEQNNEKKAK